MTIATVEHASLRWTLIGSDRTSACFIRTRNGRRNRLERDQLLLRIDELKQTLEHTRPDDVRETLQEALSICLARACRTRRNPRDRADVGMPEHVDRVTVSLNSGDVIIPWDARQALMRRLLHVRETGRLRAGFDAVGASRPVDLHVGQRSALLVALEGWSLDLGWL